MSLLRLWIMRGSSRAFCGAPCALLRRVRAREESAYDVHRGSGRVDRREVRGALDLGEFALRHSVRIVARGLGRALVELAAQEQGRDLDRRQVRDAIEVLQEIGRASCRERV